MSWFSRKDTQPIGKYEFSWRLNGYLVVSTLEGDTKVYSEEVLARMANARGFSQEDREMASAALEWIGNHPYERKSNEYNTTPGL